MAIRQKIRRTPPLIPNCLELLRQNIRTYWILILTIYFTTPKSVHSLITEKQKKKNKCKHFHTQIYKKTTINITIFYKHGRLLFTKKHLFFYNFLTSTT